MLLTILINMNSYRITYKGIPAMQVVFADTIQKALLQVNKDLEVVSISLR